MRKSGFTLVELLVSITIMAILASVGFAVYTQAQKVARDGKRKQDIKEVQKAVEQYYSSNAAGANSYPTNSARVGSSDFISLWLYDLGLAYNSSYFVNGLKPKDPINDSSYNYKYYPPNNSTCSKYIVCTHLEVSSGNKSALPNDACIAWDDGITSGAYYCLGALQK